MFLIVFFSLHSGWSENTSGEIKKYIKTKLKLLREPANISSFCLLFPSIPGEKSLVWNWNTDLLKRRKVKSSGLREALKQLCLPLLNALMFGKTSQIYNAQCSFLASFTRCILEFTGSISSRCFIPNIIRLCVSYTSHEIAIKSSKTARFLFRIYLKLTMVKYEHKVIWFMCISGAMGLWASHMEGAGTEKKQKEKRWIINSEDKTVLWLWLVKVSFCSQVKSSFEYLEHKRFERRLEG